MRWHLALRTLRVLCAFLSLSHRRSLLYEEASDFPKNPAGREVFCLWTLKVFPPETVLFKSSARMGGT